MQSIKVKDVSPPVDYIRAHADNKRVDDFVRIALNLSPADKIPKDVTAKTWPFPPIIVAKNEKPEPVESDGKKSKKKKKRGPRFFPYEIIDGEHRIRAARKIGMTEIPAVVKNIPEPAERFLEQFNASAMTSLPLGPIERANAIWRMVNVYEIPQTKLAEKFNLHKSSISRIASKKQGWGEKPGRGSAQYGKKSGQTEAAKTEADGPAPALFSPVQWYDHLLTLLEEYENEGEDKPLSKYLAKRQSDDIENLSNFVRGLLDDLTELLTKRAN